MPGILAGKRAITADTALRLARYFRTDAQSWINLQARYDVEVARRRVADILESITDVFFALDREGRFTTPNLSPGQYKVRISYVGFKDEERSVTLEPGGQARVEVKLMPHVSEEVTVTASRYRGEVSALNQKKNAEILRNPPHWQRSL